MDSEARGDRVTYFTIEDGKIMQSSYNILFTSESLEECLIQFCQMKPKEIGDRIMLYCHNRWSNIVDAYIDYEMWLEWSITHTDGRIGLSIGSGYPSVIKTLLTMLEQRITE